MPFGQGKTGWEQAIEDGAVRAETEVRRVIAYLNDEVVPEIRRDSSRALRSAAGELTRLADSIERRRTAQPSGGAATSESRSAGSARTAASR